MNLHPVSAWIAALFVLVSGARATTFMIVPFQDFVKDAPHIVRGRLDNIRVEKGITADGTHTLYTYATLDVREVLKGPISASTLQVRKLGGTLDGVTLDVPSSPVFAESEDTVVFLGPAREDQSYEVWGLELGKFALREESGEEVLVGGILEYSRDHAGDFPHTTDEAVDENRKTWTLRQLRELAARSEGGTQSAPTSRDPQHPASTEAKESRHADAEVIPSPQDIDRAEAIPASGSTSSSLSWKLILGILGLLFAGIYLLRGRSS